MAKLPFWLRWSRRDLRARWLQVTAIALIIALGTGVYAGLVSSTPWRDQSLDDSYALLNMYDLRVRLTSGSHIEGDQLLTALSTIPHGDQIEAIEPRLIEPTLVQVSTENEMILVPGQIIGVSMAGGGPLINGIYTMAGRGLDASDAGQDRAMLEYAFARYYELPASGTFQISGGKTLSYVGQGMTPEYFMVIADEVGYMSESNFAVVMLSLDTAQKLTEHPAMINDLVIKLREDADQAIIKDEIQQAMRELSTSTADITFMTPDDDPAYQALYADVKGDDQIWKLIAGLFLAGAAFGAFTLSGRIVEAQRREIGIGMALGVPRRWLAFRPLLVGAQIAVLGVVLGLVLGWAIGEIFANWLQDLMPMPVFNNPFQLGIFSQAALLGILLPFAATLYPVWRAVRVPPVDAIKTGYLVSKGGGLVPLLTRVPVPGKSFTQMPLRNLLRAPRRTVLTLLGIGMAITTLIAMFGMLDSLLITIDDTENEFLKNKPDRMVVTLNMFYPLDSGQLSTIQNTPALSETLPALQVGGELTRGDEKFEVAIELMDLGNALWTPTIVNGERPTAEKPGILINQKAAHDLGVKLGDTITVKHPVREGLFSFRAVESEMIVRGIHANPLRFLTYMDISYASHMGLEDTANILYVNPAVGVSQGDVQRIMFEQPGVASVKTIASLTHSVKDTMELLVGFMYIVAGAAMVLAFLIAFNSTSINLDERAREIATQFAFGLPIRTVTRMAMLENLVTGMLGTLFGIGFGFVTLTWLMNGRMADMVPDVSLAVAVSAFSLLMAVLMGVMVVALTPLLSIRRMSRMDLPSTLRVME
jgi:putative ABC transport system permease protein